MYHRHCCLDVTSPSSATTLFAPGSERHSTTSNLA